MTAYILESCTDDEIRLVKDPGRRGWIGKETYVKAALDDLLSRVEMIDDLMTIDGQREMNGDEVQVYGIPTEHLRQLIEEMKKELEQ